MVDRDRLEDVSVLISELCTSIENYSEYLNQLKNVEGTKLYCIVNFIKSPIFCISRSFDYFLNFPLLF